MSIDDHPEAERWAKAMEILVRGPKCSHDREDIAELFGALIATMTGFKEMRDSFELLRERVALLERSKAKKRKQPPVATEEAAAQ
jgi:hypothetical protein